jgi:hypothetical protein
MISPVTLGLRELGVAIVCVDARPAHQNVKRWRPTRPICAMQSGTRSLRRTGFYKEAHTKTPAAHGARLADRKRPR